MNAHLLFCVWSDEKSVLSLRITASIGIKTQGCSARTLKNEQKERRKNWRVIATRMCNKERNTYFLFLRISLKVWYFRILHSTTRRVIWKKRLCVCLSQVKKYIEIWISPKRGSKRFFRCGELEAKLVPLDRWGRLELSGMTL